MKQYKLPKKFWVKGKSKFFIFRLIEEGIVPNKEAVTAYPWWLQNKHNSYLNQLIKKLNN